MKNKLIDSVIAKMGETLSPQELFALRKALEFELECYEIFPTPDNENKAKKPMMNWLASSSLPAY